MRLWSVASSHQCVVTGHVMHIHWTHDAYSECSNEVSRFVELCKPTPASSTAVSAQTTDPIF